VLAGIASSDTEWRKTTQTTAKINKKFSYFILTLNMSAAEAVE